MGEIKDIEISETNRGKEQLIINKAYKYNFTTLKKDNTKVYRCSEYKTDNKCKSFIILNDKKEILKYESLHNHSEQDLNASILLTKHKIKAEIRKRKDPFDIKPKRIYNEISQKMKYNYYEIEKFQLVMEYAKKHNIILELNDKTDHGNYPLLQAIRCCPTETIQLLMEYAKAYDIVLKLNEKNNDNDYPLLLAIDIYEIKKVQLIINYAEENHIILDLNGKNKRGEYPLLFAIKKISTEYVELLMDYAKKYHITLELNEKNNNGDYPLLVPPFYTSISVKLLIDYAKEHNIVLELNVRNKYGNYPLLVAYHYQNFESIKLLKKYAKEHHITLELNEIPKYYFSRKKILYQTLSDIIKYFKNEEKKNV